ncbi:hypothetical protein [Variovorax sp. LT1R16]|uniref:hypothetical protein n=1 Tax=Variovorax sp. LT1R16 TaxID=3443728 RepID=UPI003F44FEC2
MTPEQLQELALNLSSVTRHLRRENEGAAARIAQASQQLDHSASRLSADVDAAHREGQKSMQRELTNAEQFLQKAQRQLLAAQKAWLWKVSLALLSMAVLVVGGSSYWVWHNAQALQEIDYNRQVLGAIAAGDLNLCNQRLCAKVPPKAEKFGDGYVVIGNR